MKPPKLKIKIHNASKLWLSFRRVKLNYTAHVTLRGSILKLNPF